jgi:hypothetical protein
MAFQTLDSTLLCCKGCRQLVPPDGCSISFKVSYLVQLTKGADP